MLCGCSIFNGSSSVQEHSEIVNKKIAIFPVSVGINTAATGEIEEVLSDILIKEKRFKIIPTTMVTEKLKSDKKIREEYDNYYSMLTVLFFSDDKLSKKIGETLEADYFLFPIVEFWSNVIEEKKEYAKVSLKLILVEAASGKIMWRETKNDKERIIFGGTDLRDVARGLAKDILNKSLPSK